MATTEPAKQAARRPRRWLKRMATGLLVGMALLALFHRPLIQHGARWLAIRMAGQSHLKLDLHVGGNLYDRLGLHGWKDANGQIYGVRDFLDFVFFNGGFHWATFNFADSYLVTGAIMLVLHSFWQPQQIPTPSIGVVNGPLP